MDPSISHAGTTYIASYYISDFKRVRRTWRERLLTRPWKPLTPMKTVPDSKMIQLVPGAYLCSYRMFARISEEIEKKRASGSK